MLLHKLILKEDKQNAVQRKEVCVVQCVYVLDVDNPKKENQLCHCRHFKGGKTIQKKYFFFCHKANVRRKIVLSLIILPNTFNL